MRPLCFLLKYVLYIYIYYKPFQFLGSFLAYFWPRLVMTSSLLPSSGCRSHRWFWVYRLVRPADGFRLFCEGHRVTVVRAEAWFVVSELLRYSSLENGKLCVRLSSQQHRYNKFFHYVHQTHLQHRLITLVILLTLIILSILLMLTILYIINAIDNASRFTFAVTEMLAVVGLRTSFASEVITFVIFWPRLIMTSSLLAANAWRLHRRFWVYRLVRPADGFRLFCEGQRVTADRAEAWLVVSSCCVMAHLKMRNFVLNYRHNTIVTTSSSIT